MFRLVVLDRKENCVTMPSMTTTPTLTLPQLYSLSSKGKTQVWSIRVEGNELVSTYGVLDGAMQVERKAIQGKNIGKANETTPEQQALLEAPRVWKTKVDKGYVESIEELSTPFLPMLAKPFEENSDKVKFPCYIQPKLDGIRCMAYWVGDELVLMSRGGKPLDVPHIQASLANSLVKDGVLDGELYIHGKNFQEITRLVKKVRPESVTLEYHVYDGFRIGQESKAFSDRIMELVDSVSNPDINGEHLPPHVNMVENKLAWNPEQIQEAHTAFESQGYEGIMIRNLEGAYKLKHRSADLLKLKSFLDSEYKVVGYETGDGRFEGVPIWLCETPEGKTFSVVCKGTMEEKADDMAKADSLVGKWLKVKYFELSEDNVPRFPVGLGFRMEEDRS